MGVCGLTSKKSCSILVLPLKSQFRICSEVVLFLHTLQHIVALAQSIKDLFVCTVWCVHTITSYVNALIVRTYVLLGIGFVAVSCIFETSFTMLAPFSLSS